ncbi:MAG: SLBB domain-containing protein [Gemmatimonadetes bacterium]|nr:SLBB domain-containing protein [Gemmatimonadota bacterium]
MKPSFQRFLLLLALQMLVSFSPFSLKAQTPAQQEILRLTGQQVSEEQILNQLAQSGLSRAEMRARLTSMGLNPSIADAYFDRLEGLTDDPLEQNADFLQALAQMGLLNERTGFELPDTIDFARDSLALALDSVPDSVLTVFGRSVFGGATTEFDPVVTGPVDPDYTLGPGDQLQLILTGDVELALRLEVTREGLIVIPDAGPIFVNGLTLGDLTDRLYASLGAVYSGVRRGPDATTIFYLSLGSLRSNLVYIVGDVSLPGGYQISSVATVFNALYRAGGPGEQGSMRSIEVRRGSRLVAQLDLYDYLIRGDASADIRLEQGDRIFVPIVGPQVTIQGLVRRPAIYELRPGEQLRDLIAFAGGPRPAAYMRRIQIDRILPSAQRTPGRERVLLDVDLETMPDDEDFALLDGDRVTVLSIGDRRDNQVVVAGYVEKPGLFELVPNMTLGDVLTRAGGLLPDAFNDVAHLIRLVPSDSSTVLERVSLDAGGRPVPDVLLREMDRVVIYGRSELRTDAFVSIEGEIKNPGLFPLHVGMTAEDLLLASGGFTERADPFTAQLVRREGGLVLGDTVAVSHPIVFDRSLPSALDLFDGVVPQPGPEMGEPARDVELRDGDRIFVRRLQGLRDAGDVVITGEVLYPGPYALERRGETVSSLLARAGGLTAEAYVEGASLIRGGLPLGLNLVQVLDQSRRGVDLILQPGDSLQIPEYDGTVQIIGAVEFQSRTRWRRRWNLGDYLEQAGGTVRDADRNATVVTYANQERQHSSKFLWLFRNDPRIEPGSTISVPFKPPREGGGMNANQLLAYVTSLVTLIVLFDQLKN